MDTTLLLRVVDLAMRWTSAIDGDLWFIRMNAVQGEDLRVGAALASRLIDPVSRFATVHRQGADLEWRVQFSTYGHMTLEERSSLPLARRLAVLRSASVGRASQLDRSATTGDVGSDHPSWFVEQARRDRKLPQSYYPNGRHLDDSRVPDACVEQVLTQAHLDAAQDLSGWDVEEVAAGRFLVTHPAPSAWFLPAPNGEQGTRVNPNVLARAREDFGAMILSERDL